MTARIPELAVPQHCPLPPWAICQQNWCKTHKAAQGGPRSEVTEGKRAVRAIVLYFWAGTTLAAHSQNRVWLAENERNHINQ